MHNWQRFAVHLVGQQRIRMECLVQGEGPLIGNLRRIAHGLIGTVIGPGKHHIFRGGLEPSTLQHLCQRHPRPLGIAHNAVPCDLFHDLTHLLRPILRDGAVATTLQRHLQASLGQCQKLLQAKAQRLGHLPLDLQSISGGIQPRRLAPMVADVEQFIGCDLTLQRRWGSREGATARVGRDQLRPCLDDGLLHTHVSLYAGSLYSRSFFSS